MALGTTPGSVPVIGTWFTAGAVQVDWALRIDSLTVVMLIVVNTVSALVHLYSIGYMAEDPSRPRFFAYLSLFTFAMLMLVTADNLVQMFFGWEGVGLASYLLIGFWYQKPSANAAAIKAFVVNRVGDFGFMIGIFLVFYLTNSVAFDQIFAAAPSLAHKTIHVFSHDVDAMTVTCLFLFMGAMGKSAQFLLHTWLPDAMEGPTPVSALIHAATMGDGRRLHGGAPLAAFRTGARRTFLRHDCRRHDGLFRSDRRPRQNDIKRVIAYSTCSQLGYMFVGIGVGGYSLGIFHLFTHAFFKALLFLGAGSVIHAMHHEQDMRHMGGLAKKIPFTFWMMVIGTFALTGFPLTAGFFSKDAIIEAAFASDRPGAFYAFLAVVVAAGLTSFYSWRLIFMTFFGEAHWGAAHTGNAGTAAAHGAEAHLEPTNDPHDAAHTAQDHDAHGHDDHGRALDPHESPAVMLIPLFILAMGCHLCGPRVSHLFHRRQSSGFLEGRALLRRRQPYFA